ncbi:MAG: NAD(P)H-dependent oxidoreductase [Pseudomonadota bacterium]
MTRILRLDASARKTGSVSRALNDRVIDRFADAGPVSVTTRDLSENMPLIDEAWIGANFTPEADRTDDQRAALALSDSLIAEVKAADILVIGVPIYNFGVPTVLKAWVDQIARAGVTFRYSPDGPVGLLTDKRAILAVASGGTQAGSEIDFASSYMRHVLRFVGIQKIDIVRADRQMVDAEASRTKADADLAALPVAA